MGCCQGNRRLCFLLIILDNFLKPAQVYNEQGFL